MLYLHRQKSGVYYFIRPVPPYLQKTLHKKRFSRSLQTKDHATAKKLAYELEQASDDEMQKAESLSKELDRNVFSFPRPPITKIGINKASIHQLAGQIKRDILTKDDDLKNRWAYQSKNYGLPEIHYIDIADENEKLRQAFKVMLTRKLYHAFDENYNNFMKQHRLEIVSIDETAITELKVAMLAATCEAYTELVNRDHGDARSTDEIAPPVQLNYGSADGKNFMTIWELWNREKGESVTNKTKMSYKQSAEQLNEFVTGKAAAALVRTDYMNWIDSLAANKKNYTITTIGNKLAHIQVLIKTGIAHQVLTADYTTGLKAKGRIAEEHRAFTAEEARDIMAVVALKPSKGKTVSYKWLTMLALATGARIEELAQLTFKDIYQENSRWVIELTDSEEGKHLKNKASVRRIPLHKDLIAVGFPAFVAQQKLLTKSPFVFYELKPNKYNVRSDSFSKWAGRAIDEVNKSEAICAHSFRHLMRHMLSALTAPVVIEEVKDRFLGHTNGSVGRNYGATFYPLEPLIEAIDRVRLPPLLTP